MAQIKSNRSFVDVETGEKFDLYVNSDAHSHSLIAVGSANLVEGSKVNGFYICTFTSCHIKINGKNIVYLPTGTFYNVKEGEIITHKKFCGFKRFQKV